LFLWHLLSVDCLNKAVLFPEQKQGSADSRVSASLRLSLAACSQKGGEAPHKKMCPAQAGLYEGHAGRGRSMVFVEVPFRVARLRVPEWAAKRRKRSSVAPTLGSQRVCGFP
jgi:hypothetical protein